MHPKPHARRSLRLIVAGVAIVAASSFAALASNTVEPFADFDTEGADAVLLSLFIDGKGPARVLVPEGGAASVGAGGTALIIEVESISTRGDAVRLGLYEAEDARTGVATAERWIEDIELSIDAPIAAAERSATLAGIGDLEIGMLSVRLVNR